jgi:hypothetical protein
MYHRRQGDLTSNFIVLRTKMDRLCSLVVRVSGYETQMCYVSCEVRAELMYLMY